MEQQPSAAGGYGKKSVGKWILIYVVIAIVVYGIIYLIVKSNSGGYTTETTSTYPAVTVPAPTAQSPVAPAPLPAPTASAVIQNFSFSPATLTVKAGTIVTWTNNDSAAHTVTSDAGNLFNSPTLAKGQSFSFTFARAGSYPYHCAIHPTMKAMVIVQ